MPTSSAKDTVNSTSVIMFLRRTKHKAHLGMQAHGCGRRLCRVTACMPASLVQCSSARGMQEGQHTRGTSAGRSG